MKNDDERDLQTETLRNRLSRLSAASLRINESLDPDTVLQEILDSARSLTNAQYGVLATFDDAGQVEDFLTSGLTAGQPLTPKGISLSLPFPSPSNASTALCRRRSDAARHRRMRHRATGRDFQPADTQPPPRGKTRGIRNDPCYQWTYKIELDSLRSVLSAGYVGRYRWVHRKPFYPSWRVPFPLSDSLGKPCV